LILIDLSHGMILAQPLCKGHMAAKRVGSPEAGHLERASATLSGALRKEKIEVGLSGTPKVTPNGDLGSVETSF
jgi:hypothetical protein